MNPPIVILEPLHRGHHLSLYVREIVRELSLRGRESILLTSHESMESPEVELLRMEFGKQLRLFPMRFDSSRSASPWNLFKHQVQSLKAFRDAHIQISRHAPFAEILVPHLNHFDKALGIFGSPFRRTPFSAILLAPMFHLNEMGLGKRARSRDWFDRWIFQRLLRTPSLKNLFLTDPAFQFYLKQQRIFSPAIRSIPEFIATESTVPTSHAVNRSAAGKVRVLIFGAITERKCLAELLTAFRDPRLDPCLHLSIVGRVSSEVLSSTASVRRELRQCGRLEECLGFADPGRLKESFERTDVVWIAYKNFTSMSGVLYEAMLHRKPVIGANAGVIRWLIERHRLGVIVEPSQASTIVASLNSLAKQPKQMQAFRENAKQFCLTQLIGQSAKLVCDAMLEGKVQQQLHRRSA